MIGLQPNQVLLRLQMTWKYVVNGGTVTPTARCLGQIFTPDHFKMSMDSAYGLCIWVRIPTIILRKFLQVKFSEFKSYKYGYLNIISNTLTYFQ